MGDIEADRWAAQFLKGQKTSPSPNRRFVRDGEVPVEIRPIRKPGSNQQPQTNPALEALKAELSVEHAARKEADRALGEARATIESLQARLAHAEMARDEAVSALRRSLEPRPVEPAIELLPDSMADPVPVKVPARRGRKPGSLNKVPRAAKLPKAPRPPKVAKPEAEPKPVQWWTPSFRAKSRAKRA